MRSTCKVDKKPSRQIIITYAKSYPDGNDLDWLARFILKKMRKEGIIENVSP